MRENSRGEYDGYTLPEPPKKETPETRAMLRKCLKEAEELFEQFDREDGITTKVS